jgi:BirA family biotin operon repressor/biotin-[acetyl-CoA-carboxylase] ligase
MTTAVFHWDGLNARAVADQLALPLVYMYDEVASTLDVAHELADKGAPAGTLVVADAQNAGRGRMGRSWSSEPGRGVWSTVIERPRDAGVLEVLSLRVGLYCAENLDAIAAQRVSVKWPNDLILGDRKLGGILVEARWTGTTLAWVAIGVGVNVIAPEGVAQAAGLPAGTKRVDALEAIVRGVRHAAQQTGPLNDIELRRYRARDMLAGRRIVSPAVGSVTGISADGALIVETASVVERLRAGTVQLAEGL